MSPGFRQGRRRGLVAGAAIGRARARRDQSNDQPTEQSSAGEVDQVAQLEKLAELKEKGILTEEEFALKKKEILGL